MLILHYLSRIKWILILKSWFWTDVCVCVCVCVYAHVCACMRGCMRVCVGVQLWWLCMFMYVRVCRCVVVMVVY